MMTQEEEEKTLDQTTSSEAIDPTEAEKLLDEQAREDFEGYISKQKMQRLNFLLEKTTVYSRFLAEKLGMNIKDQDVNLVENQGGSVEMAQFKQPSLVTGGVMRDYQLRGVQWLVSLYENGLNGILADEMGLGKTIQTIAFLSFLREKGVWGPFLVVAPLSTLSNWKAEFERFTPSIPVCLYHGMIPERGKKKKKYLNVKLKEKFPIVISSYDIVMNDRKYLQRYFWKYIIIDEGHRLKNLNCKLIRELKSYPSANRLLLTGTPLQNNLTELWSLLNFLLPDIFDDLKSFQGWFDFSDIEQDNGQNIISKESENSIVSSLHTILKPFLLRRLKIDVELELPKKKEYLVFSPMTMLQKEYYEATLNKDLRSFILQKAQGTDNQRSTPELFVDQDNMDSLLSPVKARKRPGRPKRAEVVARMQQWIIDDSDSDDASTRRSLRVKKRKDDETDYFEAPGDGDVVLEDEEEFAIEEELDTEPPKRKRGRPSKIEMERRRIEEELKALREEELKRKNGVVDDFGEFIRHEDDENGIEDEIKDEIENEIKDIKNEDLKKEINQIVKAEIEIVKNELDEIVKAEIAGDDEIENSNIQDSIENSNEIDIKSPTEFTIPSPNEMSVEDSEPIDSTKSASFNLVKGNIKSMKLQNLIIQLRKVCNHPFLFDYPRNDDGELILDERLVTSSGKMLLLDQLLPALFSKGHKVLIFSQMTKMLDILEDYMHMREINFCRIDGMVTQDIRKQQIEAFNNPDSGIPVFLLSTRSGGLGINLVSADTVIIYDSDWNPQMDLQAQDRVHRIGQTKPVLVFRLALAYSVEKHIIEKANSKRKLEKLVIQQGGFKGDHLFKPPRAKISLAEMAAILASEDRERINLMDKPIQGSKVLSDQDLERLLDRSPAVFEEHIAGEHFKTLVDDYYQQDDMLAGLNK